jgi:PRTRC genetic system protein A
MPIPVYLKTAADMPRPGDPEFYLLTRDGPFLCRNHPFFASDVPTRRAIRALAPHAPAVAVRYPKVKASTLETIVGFFGRVYELHGSEAVVLLLWDLKERRYRLLVPPQEASVWQSRSGRRSPQDVRYRVPALPPGQLLVGDIHSHGHMAAFTSHQDAMDEVHRDGVHAVVGRILEEPPEFHVELAIDGHRFELRFDELFEGYAARRRYVPRQWLDQVQVRVEGGFELYTDWAWQSDRG